MLRVRDFRHKLRQMEYPDAKRNAGKLDLEAGNLVLLKQQQRQKKLSSSFEPDSYRIVHQESNAAVLQNPATGDTKMSNSGHIH